MIVSPIESVGEQMQMLEHAKSGRYKRLGVETREGWRDRNFDATMPHLFETTMHIEARWWPSSPPGGDKSGVAIALPGHDA